jgi:asparagine synthase (glutamine-hydrolysing)
MGGLSAAFRVDGASVETAILRRLTEAISHRGEQVTCWVDGPVGLAHCRNASSLVDRQPAVDPTGCLRIVMNGRLYNHDELNRRLATGGVPVSSGNQLESIMNAYRLWGVDLARRLDGDFAFVLHDAGRQRILCVRDALGVKPLYYAFVGPCFLAASEQKQLLAAGVSAHPSEERIAAYLSAKPFLAGGPGTFFRDIRRLEPGQWLLLDPDGLRQRTYWQLDPHQRIAETSEEGMAQEVRRLLTDSVRRRVPAMPPYACALSGGFDSSSVAALYRRVLDSQGRRDPLETFSFEFRDLDADEPEVIRAVSAEIGARHHPVYLDHANVFNVLP